MPLFGGGYDVDWRGSRVLIGGRMSIMLMDFGIVWRRDFVILVHILLMRLFISFFLVGYS